MTWWRVLLGVVGLAAAGAAVLAVEASGVSSRGVDDAVAAAGVWGPVVFLLVYGTVSVVPVPRTLFTVTAGVLFGPVLGVGLALAGTALAATSAFLLVRSVGRRFVARHADRGAVAWVRSRVDRKGLLAMVSLRLIPAVPFSVLNYACALSGVRFPVFVLGTMLGVLPGTVSTVVLAAAVAGGEPHPALLAVSVVCGLIGLTGAVLAARRPAVPAETPPRGSVGTA